MLDDPDFLAFLRETVQSVWGLELILLLRKSAPRVWTSEELVREMRASPAVAEGGLLRFETVGLIVRDTSGVRYAPAAPDLDALTANLETCYRDRPVRLINVIVTPNEDKLKTFANAFRLKDPKS